MLSCASHDVFLVASMSCRFRPIPNEKHHSVDWRQRRIVDEATRHESSIFGERHLSVGAETTPRAFPLVVVDVAIDDAAAAPENVTANAKIDPVAPEAITREPGVPRDPLLGAPLIPTFEGLLHACERGRFCNRLRNWLEEPTISTRNGGWS
jgi:hypothetical protein